MTLSPREMAEEVARINREGGFPRDSPAPTDPEGYSPPALTPKEDGPGVSTSKPVTPSAGMETTAGAGQGNDMGVGPASQPPDPGPPRFSGIDLDAKLAIVTKSSAVLLTDDECQAIVQICLTALNRHFVESMITVGKSHGIEVKIPEQKSSINHEEKHRGRNPK